MMDKKNNKKYYVEGSEYTLRKEKENLAYTNIKKYKLIKNLGKLFKTLVILGGIIGISFIIVYPFMKLFPQVFSNFDDLGNPEIVWIPKSFSIQSFQFAWRLVIGNGNIIAHSLWYAFMIMLIQTFISAFVGYSLARVEFKGRNLIFLLVIFTFIVPPQTLLIPQYIYFKNFNLFGLIPLLTGKEFIDLTDYSVTLYIFGLLGFGIKQSLFIFIFRQFFMGIPKELEEAALIDGCGFNKTYFKIMLPNAIPALMTVAIFSFIWNYGDIYYVKYFNPDGSYLSVALSRVFTVGNFENLKELASVRYAIYNFTVVTFDAIKSAALFIFLVPLLVLYFIIQRRFVENFERSGIVG